MSDSLNPEQGPFLSALHWLDRPGQAVRNLLKGHPGAAGRQLLDFLGEIPDAVLPGNLIPDATTMEDDVAPSDLVGMDENTPWYYRVPADIALGIATDPLSLIPGKAALGAVSAGAKVANTALKTVPPLERAVTDVRRSMNWLDLSPEQRDVLDAANAAGANAKRAGSSEIERLFADAKVPEQEAVGSIFHGIDRAGPDRADWTRIGYQAGEQGPDLPLNMRMDAYLASHPELDADAVRQAVTGMDELGRTQAAEGLAKNVFDERGNLGEGYFQKQYSGFKGDAPEDVFGQASAVKGRTLGGSADSLNLLQAEPDIGLEFNALKGGLARSEQQGRMVTEGALGKAISGDDFRLATPGHKAKALETIDGIAKTDPDYAYRLKQMLGGMTKREDMPAGWFFQGLHKANRVFKSAATYGVLLPRINFTTRNQIGGLWQVLSDDVSRPTLPQAAKRALSNLFGAFDDGFAKYTGKSLTSSEMTNHLRNVDDAFKAAGGSADRALAAIKDPHVAEAMRLGVLDNFITSEDLMRRIAQTPRGKRWQDIMDAPAAIGQGLEQRMRLGTFLDLRKRGISPEDAARTIKDAYVDYSTIGTANRTMRDVLPFGAFLSQTLRQQSKFLVGHPAVAVGAAQVFGQDADAPKYDWIAQQPSIFTGSDEKGNAQFLTSLGLPIESLADIPGASGRDIERTLIGPSHPLIKTAYSALAGHDPMFGTPFMSYDKDPLSGESSEAGRYYQAAKGTGLIQPLSTPLDMVGNLLDERKSPSEKALQFATGARFASVDPDVYARQQAEKYLHSRPDVHQYTGYYGGDDDATAAMQQLKEAKARIKAKIDRAKAQSSL